MKKIDLLRKKFIGNFYVERDNSGPTNIYRVEEIAFDRQHKSYNIKCIMLSFHESPALCIAGFSWDEKILFERHLKKYKRCNKTWVKTMVGIAINDLNNFSNRLNHFGGIYLKKALK